MNERWAEDNLQVIRTLMERTAVYRRALAPVMVMAGSVGTMAAVVGYFWQPNLLVYWTSVAAVVVTVGFILTRRQALKDGEAFWSPPARRVAQALLPSIVVGIVLTVTAPMTGFLAEHIIPVWLMLYGCGFHAAGFFAPRRLRVLGWLFVIGGVVFMTLGSWFCFPMPLHFAHATMGAFFGLLHLAVGGYLYATDKGSNDL